MKKLNLKAELLVLCDSAFLSQENKLNIIGIFDQIFAAQIPSNYLKMSVAAVIVGEPETEHTVKLSIEDPNHKKIIIPELRAKLGNNGKTNIISELGNFPLPETGTYKIILEADGELLGTREFSVGHVNGSDTKVSGLAN